MKLFLLFMLAVIAFWISSISGGGASLILLPILNLLLPSSVVPFSITIGTFAGSGSRILVFRRMVNWRIVRWFVPASIPAVALGAWLIRFANPVYLQVMVGIFLVANLLQLFKTQNKLRADESPYPAYILSLIGFFAGFVSGITGATGLLFNIFYLKYGLTKEEIIATRAANEILLHMLKLIIYFSVGLYSTNALYFGLIIAGGSLASTYSIRFILPFLSEFVFRKIGYAAMIISGLFLLISPVRKVIVQDKVSIAVSKSGGNKETTIKWRGSDLTLEYEINGTIEIERAIQFEELPSDLQKKYLELKNEFDLILLEKVFRLGEKTGFEFYCYKNGQLFKLFFPNI